MDRATGPASASAALSALGRLPASSLLLFMAAHRPLSFLMAQACYLAEPVCDLMGIRGCRDLAGLLSRGDGMALIETALAAQADAQSGSDFERNRANLSPDSQSKTMPNGRQRTHVLE